MEGHVVTIGENSSLIQAPVQFLAMMQIQSTIQFLTMAKIKELNHLMQNNIKNNSKDCKVFKKMINSMDKPLTFIEWCNFMNINIIDLNIDAKQLIQWYSIDIFNICTMFIRKYVISEHMKILSISFKMKIVIDIILLLKTLQDTINEFNCKIEHVIANLAIANSAIANSAIESNKLKMYIIAGFREVLNILLQKQTNYNSHICNLTTRLAYYQQLMNASNLNAFISTRCIEYNSLPKLDKLFESAYMKTTFGRHGVIGKHKHSICSNYSFLQKNITSICISSGISNDLFYDIEEDQLLPIILIILDDITVHYTYLILYIDLQKFNQNEIDKGLEPLTDIQLCHVFELALKDKEKIEKATIIANKYKELIIKLILNPNRTFSYSAIIFIMFKKIYDKKLKNKEFIISDYFYNNLYKKIFSSLLILTLYEYAPSILSKRDPWSSILKHIRSIGNNNIIAK
jgi:uncharacterized LabA/DUF88 family protein